MEIKEFIDNFVEALEIEDASVVTSETIFKDLEEWDSLGALTTISMVDDEYSVTITNKDLKAVNTIQELFELVQAQK